MDEKTKQRIEEIRTRLLRYFNLTGTPYLFSYKGLMNVQHEFLEHGPEDMAFLLNELEKASKK